MTYSCSFNIQLSVPKTDVYVISFFMNSTLSGPVYLYKRGDGIPHLLDTQSCFAHFLKSGDLLEIFGTLNGVQKETKLEIKQCQTQPSVYSITYNLYDFVKDNSSVLAKRTVIIDNHSPYSLNAVCSHEWKHYQGLLDSYNYCVKCDSKENQ